MKDEFLGVMQEEVTNEEEPEDPLKRIPVKKEEEPESALEAMEAGMAAAAKARASAKNTSVKKKLAAIQKKPAIKMPASVQELEKKVDMTDIFKKLREIRQKPTTNRNGFTSMAYSHGRKRATNHGASIEDEKLFGQMQIQKASKLWEDTK